MHISGKTFLAVLLLTITSCSVNRKSFRADAKTLLNSNALRNAHTGISVYDLQAGKYVFNHQGDKYFVPASNVKIATCYAAMKYLGDSLPALRYAVADDGSLEISGTGDPSLLNPEFPYQPAIALIKKYRQVKWKDLWSYPALGSGWSWDDYNESYMAQRSLLPVYGNIVKFMLAADGSVNSFPSLFTRDIVQSQPPGKGFAISRSWDGNIFTVTAGSQTTKEVPFDVNPGLVCELLQQATGVNVEAEGTSSMPASAKIIYSQPTDSLLKPMMHRSDNFFAEQVLMMIGHQLAGRFNLSSAIDSLLRIELKDLPHKPRWVDGSGLSRYNLFTPMDFVTILHKMLGLPRGPERLKTILPTGGEGTLRNYYVTDSSYLYAKTGTLSGVVTLSGMITTRKGKELLFSVMVNNNSTSATEVRRAVEVFLKKLRED